MSTLPRSRKLTSEFRHDGGSGSHGAAVTYRAAYHFAHGSQHANTAVRPVTIKPSNSASETGGGLALVLRTKGDSAPQL